MKYWIRDQDLSPCSVTVYVTLTKTSLIAEIIFQTPHIHVIINFQTLESELRFLISYSRGIWMLQLHICKNNKQPRNFKSNK
jgi:hypothetical protein